LPFLRSLLLTSLLGILCSCIPPDRIDYSPDDESTSTGDDDDSTPSSGDDDDDSTPSGGDNNGDVRLVDGTSSNEGRVEVLYEGAWGTVCDDDWDAVDAVVVCNQLGLPSGLAEAFSNAEFGAGDGPIWLDNVACSGTEERLEDCEHNGWGDQNCSHGEDAGVRCN